MRLHLVVLSVAVAVLLNASCNKHHSLSTNSGLNQDCFKDRKQETFLDDQQGTVIMVADQFLILSGENRYQPCEMPESFRHQDLKILFSGSVRKIRPEERWAGTPIQLTKIRQHVSQ